LISVTLSHGNRVAAGVLATLIMVYIIVQPVIGVEYWSKASAFKLLAVDENGKGVTISVELGIVYPGTGSLKVLGEGSLASDTLDSIKLALWYASIIAGLDPSVIDTYITVKEPVKIEGPSATVLFTLVLTALMRGDPVNPSYSATGIVTPGGVIGGVGGVKAKFEAASEAGLKRVLASIMEPVDSPLYYPSITLLDAYYGFTGVNITSGVELIPRQPVAGDTILSGFNESYTYFINQYSVFDSSLPGTWSDQYRETAVYYYERALKAYEAGSHYLAASYAFTSFYNILASYLNYTNINNPAEFPEKISYFMAEANSTLVNVENLLHNVTSRLLNKGAIDICTIDSLTSVYDRVLEVKRGVMLINNVLNKTPHPLSIIYDVSYLYARSLTALKWLELASGIIYECSGSRLIDPGNIDPILGRLEEALRIHYAYLNDLTNSSMVLVMDDSTNKLERLIYLLSALEDLASQFYSLIGLENTLPIYVNSTIYNILLDEYRELLSLLREGSVVTNKLPLSTLTLIELINGNATVLGGNTYSATLVLKELSRLYTYLYLARIQEWNETSSRIHAWLNIRMYIAYTSALLAVVGVLVMLATGKTRSRTALPGITASIMMHHLIRKILNPAISIQYTSGD
jgi:predicted S18 family serine protease